ncbi:hypothetical protein [Mycobacterium lentiflavum]|uniref:Uncharacterized protein n=1 Tax=Mycobacterium lentiflavum TaxID=141349 RepID=A0ABY3UVE6_MYCLN|nr:hypothetical protein [Mycobacterium lentiflavum]ULP40979.1 hypothetical protein MJO58_18955 [Mycobacterium lentiflavum]
MSVVRAGLAEGFYFGEDAVLLALDVEGLNAFLVALIHAQEKGSSRLDVDGTIHEFLIEGTASDIEFHDDDGRAGVAPQRRQGARNYRAVDGHESAPWQGSLLRRYVHTRRTLVISLNEYT